MRHFIILVFLNAATVQFCSCQNFDPNAFKDGQFQAKFCPPYRCAKGQEPVPKWPLGLTSTGCSGLGGQATMFNPKQASSSSSPTESCCDQRHVCYQTCGSLKSQCDEQFLKCGEETCAKLDTEEERKECEQQMSIHSLMVKLDQSCHRYDQDQYSHCDCVEKKSVGSKRERVLRNFYKKYSPDSVNKVDGLLQKVDTPGKMAGLMMKLVAKYPTAIKKVKDPQQEYMEKLMKDARSEKKTAGEDDGVNDPTAQDSEEENGDVEEEEEEVQEL